MTKKTGSKILSWVLSALTLAVVWAMGWDYGRVQGDAIIKKQDETVQHAINVMTEQHAALDLCTQVLEERSSPEEGL